MLINLLILLWESRAHGWSVGTFEPLSARLSPRPSLQSRPALQHKERRLRRLPAGDEGWPANLSNAASFLAALDMKTFFFFFSLSLVLKTFLYMRVGGLIHEKMGSAAPFSFLKILFSTSTASTMKQKAKHIRSRPTGADARDCYVTSPLVKKCLKVPVALGSFLFPLPE